MPMHMKNSVPLIGITILITVQISLISEHEQVITYINDLQYILLTVLVPTQVCTQVFAGLGKGITCLCLIKCIARMPHILHSCCFVNY
jgi:hypothetical protein